jgi:hypothetical protein
MNVTAIEFESVVEGDVIPIPEAYRGKLRSPVWIVAIQESGEKQHPRKIKPFTAADFASPGIKTKDWKFNREEANER